MPPQGGRKHPHQEFIQIDTTNILFICGGAFDGIERIIQNRIGEKAIGFGAEIRGRQDLSIGEILAKIQPEDLLKFGLIPEFVGRVPVIVSLDALDQEALERILLEPRNALVKQFKKMFDLDGIDLEFKDGAIRAIAEQALQRKTGARGLRSILEDIMLDVMYDIPSRGDARWVTEEVVTKGEQPLLISVESESERKEETA